MSAILKIFGDLIQGAKGGAKEVVLKAAIKAQAQAKALVPVDTGSLRGSVSYKTFDKKDGNLSVSPKKNEAYVGSNVGYAKYVEYGTRTQAAQPFLRPSLLILKKVDVEMITSIQKEMLQATKKGVKNV